MEYKHIKTNEGSIAKKQARAAVAALNEENYKLYGITLSAAASGGRGGQGVNTTNSKAIVQVNIFDMKPVVNHLVDAELDEFIDRLKKSKLINEDGDLTIMSQEERSWHQNRENAFEKLRASLINALRTEVLRDINPPKKVIYKIARERQAAKNAIKQRKAQRRPVDPYE